MSLGVGVDDDDRPELDAVTDEGRTTIFPINATEDELQTRWITTDVAIDAEDCK